MTDSCILPYLKRGQEKFSRAADSARVGATVLTDSRCPLPGANLISRMARCALGAVLLLSAVPIAAQTATREVSFAVGASQFDASGTGTAPIAAIRGSTLLVGRWLLGEISLSYASLDEQFGATNRRVGVGEGQLQAQFSTTRVRPYIGLGGGWLHYFNNDEGRSAATPTLSGSAGLRIPIASALMLRGELRVRYWEGGGSSGFVNGAAEFTGGIGYRF